MPTTILLAGGTGFIGVRLAVLLREKGYAVRLLTRHPQGDGQFAWDPLEGRIDESALTGVHAIVNLTGAGIAEKRWTQKRKKELIDSRVQAAVLLARSLTKLEQVPKVYVSTSAIGYYGNTGEAVCREEHPPVGSGFLSECCIAWEKAAHGVSRPGLRTVVLRIGIVLAKEGGALKAIIKPLRFGLGAYFADGKAWYSWIHRDDVCRQIIWAIEKEDMVGTFNVVAPNPIRNKHFIKLVAKAMGRWILFAPVPAFVLRLALGEMADTVLYSNKVSAEKIEKTGFRCQYPELADALSEIFKSS